MANKKIFLGMLAIALVFGMTVVGCDPEDNGNYVGEWTGTFSKGEAEEPAKMIINDTDWALTSDTVNASGTYDTGGAGAIFKVLVRGDIDDSSDNIGVAVGLALGGTLTVTFNNILPSAAYSNGIGTFIRAYDPPPPPTDPFLGTWDGDVLQNGIGTPIAATITFTTDTWTLSVPDGSPSSLSGSYQRSSLGFTATLKFSEEDITYGTCLLDIVNNRLIVTFINGSYSPSTVTFTR
jgi:hypothetical protein